MSRDVMLFMPHGGYVRGESMMSVLHAMTDPDGVIAEFRDLAAGPVMGMARCAIVGEFLSTAYDWLLMVDADMVFDPGVVRTLRAAADPETAPVVGGQCWTVSRDGKYPTMYRADMTAGGEFGFTSWVPAEIPRDELVEVDATGAAFLIVHRSVFKRLDEFSDDNRNLWFAEMSVDNRLFGEDFSFCMRARAAGIPVKVCTGARVGHVKNVIIGPNGCLGMEPRTPE